MARVSPPERAKPTVAATPTVTATRTVTATPTSDLPPTAAAAAAFVGDLQAAVADGEVAQPAGQDLFNHLQPLLFGPPGQNAQQVQQQYQQLVQAFDQHQSQGQISGAGEYGRPRSGVAVPGQHRGRGRCRGSHRRIVTIQEAAGCARRVSVVGDGHDRGVAPVRRHQREPGRNPAPHV